MSDLVSLMDLRIRPAVEGDMGYIIDTWGRSLRSEYPEMRTTDFVRQLRFGIERRLATGARIDVAHPAEDAGLILGWMARTNVLIHFVYVREPYRQGGIARRLLRAQTYSDTLLTDAMTLSAREIRRAHPDRIRYIPTI